MIGRLDWFLGGAAPVGAPPMARILDVVGAAPRHALGGDHLITVQRAVAQSYRREGYELSARRVENGDADNWPRMKGGLAAAEAILRGMFE
jgi:hypothetical protein